MTLLYFFYSTLLGACLLVTIEHLLTWARKKKKRQCSKQGRENEASFSHQGVGALNTLAVKKWAVYRLNTLPNERSFSVLHEQQVYSAQKWNSIV